jgi:copper chaperone CopZ
VSDEAPRLPVRTTLRIDGMRSVHCVRAVFTALAGVEGIARADVTLGRAVVEHDGRATTARLREAVALSGYAVEESTEERPRALPLL